MQIINAKNSNVTDSNNVNLIDCNVTLYVGRCNHDDITDTLNELLERIEKLESALIECKKLIEKSKG
ncbi:hypothetical protein [Prevotella nigrescens]|jgi:hypothetical protein|uniref:hypothetical protein n=1 Tax=Prevotella nigrescens TaxID=28133 RepID=UPI00242FE3C0|nr:hypothetical protein [Prevotella nigrescens]